MSNKTRLQANNTNLQALIDKANALPEAGSGGGSVETCTVTMTTGIEVLAYGVTRYVGGVLVCEADKGYGNQEFTFDNVVKGSCLTVTFLGFDSSDLDITNCTLKVENVVEPEGIVTAFYRVND